MEKFLMICAGVCLTIEVIKLPFAAMVFMICFTSFLGIWLWWDVRKMKHKHYEDLKEQERKFGKP